MDVTSVVSSLATTGAGEGASTTSARVATPVNDSSSQTNSASIAKAVATTQAPTSNQIAQAVKQMNDAFTQRGQNIYATISIDKATGIDVVKIVDKETNETIVQYPSKAILEAAQALQHPQGSGGQLINTEA